jgi:hypothetical protein
MRIAAQHWLEAIANVRLHGQTHMPPVERFKEEQAQLNPCPPSPMTAPPSPRYAPPSNSG